MAELATGAVSSLLVVIRNEAVLLRGVRDDVQFIKEEMESMNSFLAYLGRSTPPSGEHDEQVRTWMNQVRLLAQDCHGCIDLYLYSGNPEIHRAKSKLRRHLWWVYWFLRKLYAQHRAAVHLQQLKERARDVGERRLRYGVEVPGKSAEAVAKSLGRGASAMPGGGGGGDEEDEDQLVGPWGIMAAGDSGGGRRASIEPRTLDDYVEAKLWEWVRSIPVNAGESLSMVIVAPYTYQVQDLLALVDEIWVSQGLGYQRIVLVDIQAVHPDSMRLRAKDVLFYILRELKHAKSRPHPYHKEQDPEQSDLDPWEAYFRKLQIYNEKKMLLAHLKIKENMQAMKVHEKLQKIKGDIQDRLEKGSGLPNRNKLQGEVDKLDLDVQLQLLLQAAVAASQQEQGKNRDMQSLPARIVKKLKEHLEAEEKDKRQLEDLEEQPKHSMGIEGGDEEDDDDDDDVEGDEEIQEIKSTRIHLDEAQYAHILRKLFPKSSNRMPVQAQDKPLDKQPTTDTLDGDQIKQMIHDVKKDILRELQEGTYGKSEIRIGENGVPDQKPETDSEKIGQMMDKIEEEFKEQLKIKGLMEEIKRNLKYRRHFEQYECPLFVLKVDELTDMDVSTLEDTRNALSLLNNSADIMVVTTTKDIRLGKEYCYPQLEPIDYSLTGLYNDTMLKLTSQLKNQDNYHPQILHDILHKCEPDELCMKIFTHALYANPKRSNEELLKLHSTLQALPTSSNSIAKVMFKFSYNDLPKEYKSCLLYLAIFPPGHKISRSTLIGRWVAEGLTSKEDWSSSICQANRCFDALIARCLVYPADISATGNVKSCVVGDLVHGFITTTARKQHMVETRLSHHLARHFSIFNDLQLRSSDRIDKFFEGLSNSSRVSMLKVLDLEGCQCFAMKNHQRYLKDICNKMVLLKYLSLRRTDIIQLPSEINNLRELEVLDIRQTKVPPHATANILLLKLKRLLAGPIDLNPSNFGRIPHRIDKMVNMEVLSNVKAQHSGDLKDIGKLWQLRKLGVVIQDKDNHLEKLVQTICDLHECLRSLSITTIPVAASCEGTLSAAELPDDTGFLLKNQPKILQSLSIRGTTRKGRLLPLFIKGDKNKLAKITLSGTLLTQNDLEVLAKLPMLQCVRLQHVVCTEHMLTFKKDEFICLKYLLLEGSSLTNITFEDESARNLEKMVLSFTSAGFISGVELLPKLEELELNNTFCGRLLSSFDNAKQIAKLTLRGTEIEQDALQIITKKRSIRCLVLLDKSFGGRQNEITFKENEFLWLNLLVVDCSAVTKIIFTSGSAPRLEKIIWSSFTSLSGIDKLPRLKELEFNGSHVPDGLIEAIKKHKKEPRLKLNEPETQD
ncbi:hypothetical protein HU200_049024 [Digitaria exilis]|uniref:Rx N-terminal domain-containing protein n=1 Tax=Digitaria exilis TaxID=1010633 RepID=A0A835B0D9_9POAL|nr:hypothetical protein HU200_049024 [Digitaria exilis]CAB3490425.1 unnamed protein product [Digitaria exilis]CAB3503583.1 unnamed protein product [Digitaria exilis]